jgi:hypothetical protein
VKNKKGLSLGQARKELRPWVGRLASPAPLYAALEPSPKNRLKIEREYGGMVIAGRSPYLERERKIPPALLNDARFAGRIRRDQADNAVFPHFDRLGLCGFERKNHGFTGFAKGGEKGLWESHDRPDDHALIFAESAIDALSHAVLFPNPSARYRSIGGSLNDKQPVLIRAAIRAMPEGSSIIAAMDNDEAGRTLAILIEDCFHKVERPDLAFIADMPVQAKDWNDALRQTSPPNSPTNSFPIAHRRLP